LNISGTESNGKIINLLSNDASRIEFGFLFVPYLIISPLQAIAIIFLLVEMVDLSMLSGILLFLTVIPLQSLVAKILNRYM
jgi:ATP-binding cassette subfamily C (CFTR/MRP) protein 4